MLERVWRKGNPLTLLVGMQTSTATMENSVEIPYVFLNKEILNIWQKKKQNKSISGMVRAFENKLYNWGYNNHYVHVGPLIRREKPYVNELREAKKTYKSDISLFIDNIHSFLVK